MKYSVIDISSNSLSQIIADVDGRSPQNAEIIFKQRENLSLLTYFEGTNLSARGIEKLAEALLSYKNACKNMGVKRVYLIATAVMRGVSNADEVEEALFEKTGMRINYIDGQTEAYCDYIANAYYASIADSVLVDIGGKSIEVCDLSRTDRGDMQCLDFGILDLRKKFVKKIQPDAGEGEDIKKYVKGRFNDEGLPKGGKYGTIILAGPVCNAVYEVYSEFAGIDGEDGEMIIERKTFKKLTEFLLTDSKRSSLILKCAPEKLALIAPAAVVLRNLFKRFDVTNIIVSDRGVKEGYLKLVLSGEDGVFFEFEPAVKPKAEPAKKAPAKRRQRRAKPAARKTESSGQPAESVENTETAETAETTEDVENVETETAGVETTENQPETAEAGGTESVEPETVETEETAGEESVTESGAEDNSPEDMP